MYKKLKTLKKHHQLIYSLLIGVSVVGIWRGIWVLLDIFLLPQAKALSALISIVVGLVIITITHYKLF